MNRVINMDILENDNILVEEDNTVYEIDGKCMSMRNKKADNRQVNKLGEKREAADY